MDKKQVKGRLQHLGRNLKQTFRTRRFDGDIYGFAFTSVSRTSAGKMAAALRESGIRNVHITLEGNHYVVWENFKAKPKADTSKTLVTMRKTPPRITPRRRSIR